MVTRYERIDRLWWFIDGPHAARSADGAPSSNQDDEPGSIPGLRSTSSLRPLAPIVDVPGSSLVLWPLRLQLVQQRLF